MCKTECSSEGDKHDYAPLFLMLKTFEGRAAGRHIRFAQPLLRQR
jgi:hypothetical protein